MIFTRSENVPAWDDYRRYRDPYLRPDFRYRCAYCLTQEYFFLDGDAGEIDHHRPVAPSQDSGKDFSHLINVYDNLYWTCRKCNRVKGNTWPSDRQYARGRRFLDPCFEDHDEHWEAHPDGTVTPKTWIGRFTIRHIRLDRPRLNKRRAERYRDQQKLAEIEAELRQADITPQHRHALLRHLADVKDRIDPPVFV